MFSRLLAFFATTLAAALLAQVGGRITGTVKDPTGAFVSGASVAITNSATGAKQETKTDDQGVFAFPAVAVGQHIVEISAEGFTPYRRSRQAFQYYRACSSSVRSDVYQRPEPYEFCAAPLNIGNPSSFGVLQAALPQGSGGNRTGQAAPLGIDF